MLGRAPGVIDFELNALDDVTRVVYDPARISVKQIVAAVSVTGHQPSEVVDVEP